MKGFGTDEKALIAILCNKDPLQIDAIRHAFDRELRRDLIRDLKSETSGNFEKALLQLARGPLLADVHNLFDSMEGPGTKERVLNDVLLGRSNADLRAIKSAYQQTFRRSLEDAVKGDLSMKTERHFMMVLAANRAEDSAPVIPHQIDADVMELYKATEAKMGTDELMVCSILTQRNDNQIRAIAHAYKQKFNKDLEAVIKSVSDNGSTQTYQSLTAAARNSPGTWRTLCSSSFDTPSTSICTPPSSSKTPWPAWAPRTSCCLPASSASTGTPTSWPMSRVLISRNTVAAWPTASRARRLETTAGCWWPASRGDKGTSKLMIPENDDMLLYEYIVKMINLNNGLFAYRWLPCSRLATSPAPALLPQSNCNKADALLFNSVSQFYLPTAFTIWLNSCYRIDYIPVTPGSIFAVLAILPSHLYPPWPRKPKLYRWAPSFVPNRPKSS